MTINTLFLRKLLVAFLVGFGGVLIPSLLSILDKIASGAPASFGLSLLIALVAGAFAAGLRAVLVLLPGVNLVPSDSQPVVEKAKPATSTTHRASTHRKPPAR